MDEKLEITPENLKSLIDLFRFEWVMSAGPMEGHFGSRYWSKPFVEESPEKIEGVRFPTTYVIGGSWVSQGSADKPFPRMTFGEVQIQPLTAVSTRVRIMSTPAFFGVLQDRLAAEAAERWLQSLARFIRNEAGATKQMDEGETTAEPNLKLQTIDAGHSGAAAFNDHESGDTPRVPKRKPDFEKWRKAYPILSALTKRYWEKYESGDAQSPKPKMRDYQEALAFKMKWAPHERTIRAILDAGAAGLLKKKRIRKKG